MRRDSFDLTVDRVADSDAATKPVVHIDVHSSDTQLRERVSDNDGDLLTAEAIDVAYRLQESRSATGNAPGVVSVTNRFTGDFVLELNAELDDVRPFIRAARAYGDATGEDAQYHVEIDIDGEPLVRYDKGTFLVYDADGNLLRAESLIPSGVEL